MKYLSLLILTTFLLGCSPGDKENDLDKENLFGNVKSVKTLHFEATDKFGEIVKGERKYKRYSARLLSMYNDKGLLIEGIDLDSNLQSKTTYLYDDKGNRVEYNRYDSDGSLDSKWTYLYDDKGNEVEANTYDSDGSLDSKWTSLYDDKGNEVETNRYNSDGSLDSKSTYLYDDKGNRVEVKWYDSDGSLDSKWTSLYDDKGNEVEFNSYNSDGSLYYKSTYLYDDKGNQTEDKSYYSWSDYDFYLSIKSYDYDNQNNWIKCLESQYEVDEQGARGFRSHEITEREIEYYVQ
jgi:hypothetical protein